MKKFKKNNIMKIKELEIASDLLNKLQNLKEEVYKENRIIGREFKSYPNQNTKNILKNKLNLYYRDLEGTYEISLSDSLIIEILKMDIEEKNKKILELESKIALL